MSPNSLPQTFKRFHLVLRKFEKGIRLLFYYREQNVKQFRILLHILPCL